MTASKQAYVYVVEVQNLCEQSGIGDAFNEFTAKILRGQILMRGHSGPSIWGGVCSQRRMNAKLWCMFGLPCLLFALGFFLAKAILTPQWADLVMPVLLWACVFWPAIYIAGPLLLRWCRSRSNGKSDVQFADTMRNCLPSVSMDFALLARIALAETCGLPVVAIGGLDNKRKIGILSHGSIPLASELLVRLQIHAGRTIDTDWTLDSEAVFAECRPRTVVEVVCLMYHRFQVLEKGLEGKGKPYHTAPHKKRDAVEGEGYGGLRRQEK